MALASGSEWFSSLLYQWLICSTYLIPTDLIFIFGHSGNMLVHLLLSEQFCYVFSQSHTYYFCMYSVIMMNAKRRVCHQSTFRVDSLFSGICSHFLGLDRLLLNALYRFHYRFPNGLAGAQNQPFPGLGAVREAKPLTILTGYPYYYCRVRQYPELALSRD